MQDKKTEPGIATRGQSPIWQRPLLAFILIVLGGAALRFYHLGARSFYFDEAYQYFVTLNPLHLIRDDGHLPLSHYIQHFVMMLDDSEFALRFIPALFGIGTIIVSYFLAKLLFDRKTALLSALFIAVSPVLIYYAQEARPYAQYVFLSMASTLSLLLLLKKPGTTRYITYFLVTVACLYTHIFAILVLLAQNLFMLLYWRKTTIRLKPWLMLQMFFFIAYIPAILFILHAASGRAPLDYSLIRTIAGIFYVFIFGRLLFPVDMNILVIGMGTAIIGVALLIAIREMWRKHNETSLLFLSFAVIFIAILLANFIVTIFNEEDPRYLLFLSPLLYILVARGCLNLTHSTLRKIVIVLVLITCGAALYPYYFEWDTLGKGDFRLAAEFVKQQLESKSDLILCSEYQTQRLMRYYLKNKEGCQLITDDPALKKIHLPKHRVIFVGMTDRTALDYIRNGAHSDDRWAQAPFRKSLNQHGFVQLKAASWPGKNRLDVNVYDRTLKAGD